MEFICRYCGKVCKNANSLRNHERLCKQNPDHQKINPAGIKAMQQKNQTKGVWNKGLTKELNDSVKKAGETLHKRYQDGELIAHKSPMLDPLIRAKHKQKMQEVYRNRIPHAHARSKHGYYKGIWFESSWELMFIVYCLDHDIQFTRNNTAFPYIYNGETKSYFPDFYLNALDKYVEVKGVQTNKDLAKWEQFPEKLIIINEKSNEFKKIRQYIVKQYGKDYYAVLMPVQSDDEVELIPL